MIPILTLAATPRTAAGATVDVRLAGGGRDVPFRFDGINYRAGLSPKLRFSAAIGFDESGPTGRTNPAVAKLTFSPSTAALREQLAAFYWPGAAVQVHQRRADGSAAQLRLAGRIGEATVAGGTIQLTVRDIGEGMERAVLRDRYAGAGGLEGDAEVAGRLKRRSWGRCFGIEALLSLKAWNIYEVGDHARSLQEISAVRDKGRAGTVQLIAWAGSADATLAALKAAAVPKGGALVAPSIARVRWWTQPDGPLTVDLRGETGPGYVETIGAIASRLVGELGGAVISNAAALIAGRPDAAGLHVDGEQETVAEALDRLLYGAWIGWTVDAASGTIALRDFHRPAGPLPKLRSIEVTRSAVLPPVRERRVGFRRNQRPHNAGEIAAVLQEALNGASAFTLLDVQNCADPEPAKVTKRTGGSDWNGKARTRESGRASTVRGVLRPGTFVGLSTDPEANNSYDTIDYALHWSGDTNFYIFRNGSAVATLGSKPIDQSAPLAAVRSDGRTISYELTGFDAAAHAHSSNASGEMLFGCFAIGDVGNSIEGITFSIDGVSGRDGVDGVPGVNGADGTTYYPYYAYANSPDGNVDFTTGEPGSRAYIGVGSGTSPVEPASPFYYAWSEYKGPPFGLVGRGSMAVAGNQIIKNGGVEGWDTDAFSTTGYRNGAVASFQFPSNSFGMAGLNTDPAADASWTSLDFAWYGEPNGACQIYESGSFVEQHGGYDSSTKLQIAYDGRFVRYLKDGATLRSVDLGPDRVFFFDSSIYRPGCRITDISFTAAGTRGADGQPGQPGSSPVSIEVVPTSHDVSADYKGVAKDLPKYTLIRARQGNVEVSTAIKAGSVTLSDGVTANFVAVGSGATRLDITGMTGPVGSVRFTAMAGSPIRETQYEVSLTKKSASPPVQSSVQLPINGYLYYSQSWIAVSNSDSVSPGTNGRIDLYYEATLTLDRNGSGQLNSNVSMKLQYRPTGGSWADVPNSEGSGFIQGEGTGGGGIGQPELPSDGLGYVSGAGTLTGLTTNIEVRVLAASSGNAGVTLYGQATVERTQ